VAKGNLGGTMLEQPADGFSVGFDPGGAVGPYKEPFKFDAKISNAVLELK